MKKILLFLLVLFTVNISAQVVILDELLPAGNFAALDSDYLRGGLKTVATNDELYLKFPSSTLKNGMLASVEDEGYAIYQLKAITPIMTWELFSSGGGGGASYTFQDGVNMVDDTVRMDSLIIGDKVFASSLMVDYTSELSWISLVHSNLELAAAAPAGPGTSRGGSIIINGDGVLLSANPMLSTPPLDFPYVKKSGNPFSYVNIIGDDILFGVMSGKDERNKLTFDYTEVGGGQPPNISLIYDPGSFTNSNGIQYAPGSGISFADNTLITKEYADATYMSSEEPYIYTDGVSLVDDTVRLGGSLTRDVNIDLNEKAFQVGEEKGGFPGTGHTYLLTLRRDAASLFVKHRPSVGSDQASGSYFYPNLAGFGSNINGKVLFLETETFSGVSNIDTAQMVIRHDGLYFRGIEYSNVDTSFFSDSSLITKEYADATYLGGTGGNPILANVTVVDTTNWGTKTMPILGFRGNGLQWPRVSFSRDNNRMFWTQMPGEAALDLVFNDAIADTLLYGAPGESAVAIGYKCLASGGWSYSNGYKSKSLGNYSITTGRENTADKDYALAIGGYNNIDGYGSGGVGLYNVISERDSYAFGQSNTIVGSASLALGGNNYVLKGYVIGENNYAGAQAAAAFGHHNSAIGQASLAVNANNKAIGHGSFAGGWGKILDSTEVFGQSAFSFQAKTMTTRLKVEGDFSAVLGGKNNTVNANAENSVILGGTGLIANKPNTTYTRNIQIATQDTLWFGDGTYQASAAAAGGIPDAPSDGTTYGRKDAAWTVVSSPSESDPIYTAWDKDYDDLTNKPVAGINWALASQGTIHATNYVDNNTQLTDGAIGAMGYIKTSTGDPNQNIVAGTGLVGGGSGATVNLAIQQNSISEPYLAISNTHSAGQVLGYESTSLKWINPPSVTHTGDVTGGTALTIAANKVTNAKMADDAIGIAELSATGTASSTKYLRGDNTWNTPANTTYTGGDGINVASIIGNPISVKESSSIGANASSVYVKDDGIEVDHLKGLNPLQDQTDAAILSDGAGGFKYQSAANIGPVVYTVSYSFTSDGSTVSYELPNTIDQAVIAQLYVSGVGNITLGKKLGVQGDSEVWIKDSNSSLNAKLIFDTAPSSGKNFVLAYMYFEK